MLIYTTQTQVRRAFWADHPGYAARYEMKRAHGATQNDYPADVRSTFVDYVDSLQRAGLISERLAEKVTL